MTRHKLLFVQYRNLWSTHNFLFGFPLKKYNAPSSLKYSEMCLGIKIKISNNNCDLIHQSLFNFWFGSWFHHITPKILCPSNLLYYRSMNMILGSSTADLMVLRKVTASRPSTKRWSYVRAMYIIGLMTTWPFLTTGLSKTPCIPRIADCGGLMIGVPNREPKTPPLLNKTPVTTPPLPWYLPTL